jgi:endonuclease YncB( thermonuclease family)
MNEQDVELRTLNVHERNLRLPPVISRRCLVRSALALVLLTVPALLIAFVPSGPSTRQERPGPLADQKNTRPSAQEEKKCFSGAKAHRVVQVLDVDTVILSIDGKETKVGLLGAWVPYRVDWRYETTTENARQHIDRLLRGESVYLEEDLQAAGAHRPGCRMAYLYRASDQLFVNRALVRRGYAMGCTNYDHKYKDLFCECESEARQFGRGMWGFD